METTRFSIDLKLRQGYEFSVDFGPEGPPEMTVDELPPLGAMTGPNPTRLLAVAVAHCLSSSLLFCLRRYRIDVGEMRTTVTGEVVRNQKGRLRVGGLRVAIDPVLAPADRERAARCIQTFEDFCIVTESVRHGIPVEVSIGAGDPVAG